MLLAVVAIALVAGAAGLVGGQVQSDDRFEPNDDFSSAAEPTRGTYEGLRTVDGESDVFAVQLDEGQRITAEIYFSHAQGDVDMELYGPDESELASSMSVTDDERISYTAQEAGTYYVHVWGWGGSTNTYDLSLESSQPIQPGGSGSSGSDDQLLLLGGLALVAVGYFVFVQD